MVSVTHSDSSIKHSRECHDTAAQTTTDPPRASLWAYNSQGVTRHLEVARVTKRHPNHEYCFCGAPDKQFWWKQESRGAHLILQ